MTLHNITKAAALAALSMAAACAHAAPVTYTFSTGTAITGPAVSATSNAIAALLGANATVSGQFTYNDQATLFGTAASLGFAGNGALYTNAIANLAGSVSGHNFSDVSGGGAVFDGTPSDQITLSADLPPLGTSNMVPPTSIAPRELVFFTVGEYQLNNVRFLWLPTIGGAPADFVTGTNLPAQLPTAFTGRLALDFVLSSDPTNAANVPYYSRTVFYDGVKVTAQPVPEPATFGLMLAGVGVVGLMAARRRRTAA